MKITVLAYLEHEGNQKPDVVADQVVDALRQGKHTASILGVHGDVRKLIDAHVQAPLLGFIGQARVNVLMTNLALDKALPKAHATGK